MKSGSVIPSVEFKMILGSNVNNVAPTKEILILKNFLHNRNTGIAIRLDNIIA